MRKLLLLAVALNLSVLAARSQDVDTAELECLYRLSFLKDTTGVVTTDDLMVLRMSRKSSIFFSDSSYRLDSLLCSDQGDALRNDIIVNGAGKYGKRIVSYCILKNFEDKQIVHTDNVGGEHYEYQEALPSFDWQMTDETKKIWEYTCQKAVCDFRGRTYEAWFTAEIPLTDGPWKFNGLPGLILEVYDVQRHYSFVFVGLRAGGAGISLLPYIYTKTSREKYLKAYRNFISDPVGFISASSGIEVTFNGSSVRRNRQNNAVKHDTMERF